MDWMIDDNDPARNEVVERARLLGITGTPEKAVHHLGKIKLKNGQEVDAHVVHAVDPIITDGKSVVLIDRVNPPGQGKPALPGGFMDPIAGGGAESAIVAAAREAMEEAGIALGEGKPVGKRNMNRPFDVRVATKDLPERGIKEGDIFMVSTQAVRFDVPDLAVQQLAAGDDAKEGSARAVALEELAKGDFGIPDHYDMIEKAIPEYFAKNLVLVGNHLAPAIADGLRHAQALTEIPGSIGHFDSGEPFAELFHGEEASYPNNKKLLEGKRVFVVQSTGVPVAETCMDLMLAAKTLKRYGAKEVIAVIPCKALDRQDREMKNRFTSVGAEDFADWLKASGVDGVITVTPHSKDGMKFFEEKFGSKFQVLSTTGLFAEDIKKRFANPADVVIGAPDGADKPQDEGQARAKTLIKAVFGTEGSDVDKHRFKIAKVHTAVSDTKITGFEGDVKGKDCVIVDDMIDGGSTMINAASLLKSKGAKSVTAYATHGFLSGEALERILSAKADGTHFAIDNLVLTDTLPDVEKKLAALREKSPKLAERVQVLSTGPLLSQAIEQHIASAKNHPRIASSRATQHARL